MYLFLTPSKTDERVPSQQGAPTTCNLTYWQVSQQAYVQTLFASLGVVIGQNSTLQLAGWGGGGCRGERFLAIAHSSYSRHQIPSDTMNCLFPSNTFLPRTYYFSQISQPAKILLKNRYFEEQIRWVPLYVVKKPRDMLVLTILSSIIF